MSFDPGEFLRLAEELAQGSNDEARLRTAVGRAYYATLLQARESLGIPQSRRRRIHGEVIGRLKGRDKAAGNQLDKLETLRGEADYEMVVDDPLHQNWISNWGLARNYAQHIMGRLRSIGG